MGTRACVSSGKAANALSGAEVQTVSSASRCMVALRVLEGIAGRLESQHFLFDTQYQHDDASHNSGYRCAETKTAEPMPMLSCCVGLVLESIVHRSEKVSSLPLVPMPSSPDRSSLAQHQSVKPAWPEEGQQTVRLGPAQVMESDHKSDAFGTLPSVDVSCVGWTTPLATAAGCDDGAAVDAVALPMARRLADEELRVRETAAAHLPGAKAIREGEEGAAIEAIVAGLAAPEPPIRGAAMRALTIATEEGSADVVQTMARHLRAALHAASRS